MPHKVLVTGSDGFIGSHVVEELVRHGYEVRAFVLYNSFGSRGWLDTVDSSVTENVEFFAGDIRDPFGVKEAMKGCESVLNLAALIGIPYSYHSPANYVETNISGTLNVVQAARDLGVSKVIHTSTSEVYGTAQFVPITEDHPLVGQSPYSATKIAADQLALSYHKSFETPVGILRPFNTYGPRQSARAVIPSIITQIAAGKRSIRIGALTPTRDFSFVADTAAAFRSTLETDEIVGRVVHLGSGFEISIEDTIREIATQMGVEIELESDEARMRPADSEVERLFADPSMALKLLPWNPKYHGREGFARGLNETISWFSNPSNLVRYRPEEYAV